VEAKKPAGSPIVSCPRCRAQTPYGPENKGRPFCSERCRMIDLGKWAAEDYRVPTPDAPSDVPTEE
jgi:endogenous inhibitor of DNA gyrase (YacG/DUF329 family)